MVSLPDPDLTIFRQYVAPASEEEYLYEVYQLPETCKMPSFSLFKNDRLHAVA